MTPTKEGIAQMYQGMRKIVRNGGYRERKEVIECLHILSWFDNFGYDFYQERMHIVQMAYENERGLKEEDIPDVLKEELEIE
jgi:fructosamine-3-kinase